MPPEVSKIVWPLLIKLVALGIPITMTLLVFFRFTYKWRPPVIWPAGRRTFCWFPKYEVTAELPESFPETIEAYLTNRLAESSFQVVQCDDVSFMFVRGLISGNTSIKVAKVNIYVILPVSNPVTLQMEYAALFGAVLDTGDLWALCREIKESLEREPD